MDMAQTKSPKWRKMAISALIGAAGGLVVTKPLVGLYKSGALGAVGPSELVAALIGVLYLLIAFALAVGLLSPAIGAKFLNVEQADELREQRRVLTYATISTAAMGGSLAVLALAGPGGVVSPSAALAAALALLAGSTILTVFQWRHMDELMRNVTTETGNLSYYLVLLVGGGWAMLAHLGFARAPAPIDWLAMLFGLVLVASFIATGRRGMLVPR